MGSWKKLEVKDLKKICGGRGGGGGGHSGGGGNPPPNPLSMLIADVIKFLDVIIMKLEQFEAGSGSSTGGAGSGKA